MLSPSSSYSSSIFNSNAHTPSVTKMLIHLRRQSAQGAKSHGKESTYRHQTWDPWSKTRMQASQLPVGCVFRALAYVVDAYIPLSGSPSDTTAKSSSTSRSTPTHQSHPINTAKQNSRAPPHPTVSHPRNPHHAPQRAHGRRRLRPTLQTLGGSWGLYGRRRRGLGFGRRGR
jgi:hypothetical protein